MDADFVITVLILGDTVFASLYYLAEQRRDHQPNLLRRTLWGEEVLINFAVLFVVSLGAIGGSYLAGALSSLLGINGKDEKFALEFLGFITGLAVMRFYIVPKMVIPKFTQATRDQEEPPLSPLPPQDP